MCRKVGELERGQGRGVKAGEVKKIEALYEIRDGERQAGSGAAPPSAFQGAGWEKAAWGERTQNAEYRFIWD